MEYIWLYVEELVVLLLEMAPWLIFGFIFAGLLHVYMPKGSVRRFMGSKNVKSAIYAAILGIPLPLCSCGVIPTGISFYKEGASKNATVSFLISTPQTGVDSILATYALLGLPFAVIRPIVAFFSGIFGGAVTNLMVKDERVPVVESESIVEVEKTSNGKFLRMMNYAFYEFLMDIAKWLIIGFALAALISVLLPDEFFTLYLQNEFMSMLIVLAASVPIYVCATGSIPIAAVLMMKGLSPGAALVFLMAGPATNIATMTVIGKAIGKKTLVVYLITIGVSAVFFGFLTNLFLPREWFVMMPGMHGGHDHELLPYWLKVGSAIALILLIIAGYIRRSIQNNKNTETLNMENKRDFLKVSVEGMTCNHCKANVEKSLSKLEGVTDVVANPDTDEVIIRGELSDTELIRSTVEDIGYTYKGKLP